MKAIRVYQPGAPDVLLYEEVPIGKPGPGEVLVRNHAIGVNYTDIYSRNGTFEPDSYPFTPGKEAAGVVMAVGKGVSDFAPGDRVAYVETPGAYAEQTIVPTHFMVHLPASIDFANAAASLLKGLTAQYLLRQTFRVGVGHTVLVHAAAGGVGSILTQWAKHLGANVIGTVGSDAKAEIARQNGCDHVINYNRENFVSRVKKLTAGERCHVVYDSVGAATFPGSLDCLRPFGYFVSFGLASGKIPPFDIMLLVEKGSLYATWPGLTQYLDKRSSVLSMSQELFEVIASGAVKIPAAQQLPLSAAGESHRRMEARDNLGVTVLIP